MERPVITQLLRSTARGRGSWGCGTQRPVVNTTLVGAVLTEAGARKIMHLQRCSLANHNHQGCAADHVLLLTGDNAGNLQLQETLTITEDWVCALARMWKYESLRVAVYNGSMCFSPLDFLPNTIIIWVLWYMHAIMIRFDDQILIQQARQFLILSRVKMSGSGTLALRGVSHIHTHHCNNSRTDTSYHRRRGDKDVRTKLANRDDGPISGLLLLSSRQALSVFRLVSALSSLGAKFSLSRRKLKVAGEFNEKGQRLRRQGRSKPEVNITRSDRKLLAMSPLKRPAVFFSGANTTQAREFLSGRHCWERVIKGPGLRGVKYVRLSSKQSCLRTGCECGTRPTVKDQVGRLTRWRLHDACGGFTFNGQAQTAI
ncbi:hypothetical protein RRG08_036138 [Elysia crispata]|uniref:Uncharacterized protein n=1 Tax=Elysia crispata TaxID=231223 RepID=A0AAE0ZJC7_9GAST|nr:hypothetical protein RRG08_036138 [Elysia crispata]